MKVGNKLLNRIVVVATLAVVFISNIAVAFASESGLPSYDVKYIDNDNSDKFELFRMNFSAIHRVTFINKKSDFIGFVYISKSPSDASCVHLKYVPNYGSGYQVSSGNYKLGSENANESVGSFDFTYNDTTYYIAHMSFMGKMSNGTFSGSFGSFYSVNDDQIAYNFRNYITQYITGQLDETKCTLISDRDSESSSDESTWKGSQDNPKKDTDIGYLVLKNTNVNQQSDLGTLKDGVLPLYFNIDWKDKTSTGFSLTKNKYARTFIQMEVESKFVVYSDVKHTKIKHKFDNYGERGWLSKNIDPSNKPITFDSGDINNALPLTYNEILNQVDKNKIYGSLGQAIFPIGYNFLIRYRIVCTDSLTVIPDTSSGWHAGPWASTILSGDDINDTSSNKSDHEGYGDDKNKNGETDDINHTRTDYDDNQDAKDNINDKKNDKSSLDLDSAKEFINQVADVPKMIGDIFSFLPDWVKYSFAFGFALIPILIVFKLVRG